MAQNDKQSQSGFADEIAASLPAKITLPIEFRMALDWLEREGCVHTYRNTGARYAFLFPGEWSEGMTMVTFQACDPDHVRAWTRSDAAKEGRLAPIIRTGGDGSYAALWLDDSRQQRIVHMGSGSGSTMMGVLCTRPVDMLRLMAIGYGELCWPDQFNQTPEVVYHATSTFAREGDAKPPAAFRAFVAKTFGVTIPSRANEIVKRISEMGDETSDDPFWNWIRSFDK